MNQNLAILGIFLFGVLYFSNKKGVKKMIPKLVVKYKKLFMGIAVALVVCALLQKNVVEGWGDRCEAPDPSNSEDYQNWTAAAAKTDLQDWIRLEHYL